MRGKARFVVSFLLVLAGTFVLVALLSAMTQDSPQAAAERYLEQLHAQQQVRELSAPATGQQGISLLASLAGFLCILFIPVTGWLMLAKSRRNSQRAQERRRSRRQHRAKPVDLRAELR